MSGVSSQRRTGHLPSSASSPDAASAPEYRPAPMAMLGRALRSLLRMNVSTASQSPPAAPSLASPLRSRAGQGRRPRERRSLRASLFVRVLVINGVVLAVATLLLALTPATVSFPVALEEALVLGVGLVLMVVANAVLLHVGFQPVSRLVQVVRSIDLLRPGQRLPLVGGAEVREVIQTVNEMLERLEDERRRSSSRALSIQDEERQRIGHELHDEIGQRLTGILLQLTRALRDAPAEIRPNLLEAQEAARATLDEVGRLAWQLRPGILDDLGLASALDSLATTFEEHTGLRVERTVAAELPQLAPGQELALYRVAQEALTNVMRHAEATRVSLAVDRPDGAVRLVVADDGRGLDETAHEGWGIRGMRERALLVGGELEVRSRPGEGVRLVLEIPVSGTG